jgi:hypothetical protein
MVLWLLCKTVLHVAALFDKDGIAVRFFNSDVQGNKIK